MLVELRTDITGIVSNNITLVFEVAATSSNTSESQNFTITEYISSSVASVIFEGLQERQYYRFRSRVFNIYGASQYSPTSTRVLIGEHMHIMLGT